MLKSLLLLSAAMLFVIAPASVSGRIAQEAAPAQNAAQAAQAPAAQAAAPVKGPMAPDAKNPVTPTAASLAEAKTVYNRDCALCHGDNGNGKTDLATSMQLTLADWTDPKSLAAKHDGELFNMIRVGNSKMPGEDAGRAKDVVVWNMILYIRGLSKAQTAAAPVPVSAPAARASQQ
jgi:mono/diheme cytochrome c family protein